MTERQIVNWLLGFVIGILTVLAWQRVMSEPLSAPDSEATRAEELISIYKRGM
jgi:F0F1-type ATP synthase assembly protein I